MTSFRLAGCICRRGAFRGFFLAGLLLGLFGASLQVEAAPRTKPAKSGSPRGAPRPLAPSSEPSSSSRESSPIWDLADAWPSQLHAPSLDLLLRREDERKAEALALFAHALLADDNADGEKALAAYRKTLEFDPGYAELAVKVAYELARRNDVSGGIQVLKDAIKAAPKEPLPLIYLSQLYSKHLKKPELALKYAEQALALAPENFLCHSALYELHVAAGQPAKAEQALERAAKTLSTDPRFWIQLGDLYTRLYLKDDGSSEPADLQKMSAVYRKAAELDKDDPVTLAKVGDYFVLSRQVKDAIPFYQGALQLKPGVRDATLDKIREKLARAYMINQQNDEAIALLEEMTTGDSLRFDTFELLGELYAKKGDLDKALANFEHSVLLDGSHWQNYLRLAEMLLQTKRFEKAAETMRTARTRFPDLPQVTFSLGIALSKAKKHTEAMTVFAEAQAEAQNNHDELLTSSFYLEYGAAAEQAGLTEKAAELLKRAIELDPQNAAEAYNYLGYMWVDRGENLDEAGELIRKAVQMAPDNAAFMDSLGWFYFKKGEHEKALVELLRAAEAIKPPDAVIFDHIGDAYHALGKPAEALQYWQKALALERDNRKISDKIGALKQNVSSNTPAVDP